MKTKSFFSYINISHLAKSFTLDSRSLSTFRVALGLAVIWDLFARSHDLIAHYTDAGVYPRAVAFATESIFRYSFHFGTGDPWGVGVLFIIHAFFALLFVLGWQTRLVGFLLWLFTLSLQNRNYLVNQGGDVFLRMLLLWSVFLPLNQYASADHSVSPMNEKKADPIVLTIASFGLVVQILGVYFYSSLLKMGEESWQNGLGVYYALASEQLATPLGLKIARIPWVVTFGTFATVLLEFLAPIIYLIPTPRNILRSIICAMMISFHLVTALFLEIGIFPLVGSVAWIALFPPEFWKFTTTKVSAQKWLDAVDHTLTKLPRLTFETSRFDEFFAGFATAACIFIIYVTAVWNLHAIQPNISLNSVTLDNVSLALGLDQKWSMFTKPIVADGWFVIPGQLEDGSMVSLRQFPSDWQQHQWNKADLANWDKPDSVVNSVPRDRWRKYMMNMYGNTFGDTMKMNFAKYLCRSWNFALPKDQQLQAFHVYFIREDRLPTFENAEPQRVPLWKHECFTGALERYQEDFE